MGAQPGSTASAIPATASVVGNAFVNQYYNVLHQSPHVVHRFYTDASKLSRAEVGPNGVVDTVVTQSGIHEKVMSLDYGDVRAEIKTVDSQESLNGSVLVMVTGALFSQSRGKRNFVQTFFLAPQEKGYFVLNDMFRYLDEDPQLLKPLLPIANGISGPPTPSAAVAEEENETRDYGLSLSEEEVSAEDQYDLPEQVEAPELEKEAIEEVPPSHPEMPAAPAAVAAESLPTPAEEAIGEVQKKSYASIVRVRKDSSGAAVAAPQASPSKATSAQVDRFASPPPQAAQVAPPSTVTSSISDHVDESTTGDSEGDGRSVYVKNLPLQIKVTDLEEEFGKFGQLKPEGVNLRNQKLGVCFAFIEFEEQSSAQSAIEASPIAIGGRLVYVEEKRTMPPRAGRGRFNQGRGYQNDGTRGRGYYVGRGLGRGMQDSDRDYGRGRGSGTGRGGYGGGNSFAGNSNLGSNPTYINNGYRRSDSQAGYGPRTPRRGAGNQMGRNGSFDRSGSTVTAA